MILLLCVDIVAGQGRTVLVIWKNKSMNLIINTISNSKERSRQMIRLSFFQAWPNIYSLEKEHFTFEGEVLIE